MGNLAVLVLRVVLGGLLVLHLFGFHILRLRLLLLLNRLRRVGKVEALAEKPGQLVLLHVGCLCWI